VTLNFRRITSRKSFIPQIDGLRFVAISSVVLFHLYASLNHEGAVQNPAFDTASLGLLSKRGVELFFAISGFILGVPFASACLRGTSKVKLKQYFLRRLTRLEPPYILSLLVWTGILFAVKHQSVREILPHLLSSMAYLHNLIYNGDSTINVVAWSLEVEVQFYILVPLLAGLFAISDTRLRRGVIAVVMLGCALLGGQLLHTRLQASVAYYLPFFLAGFLLCDLYVTRQDWKPSWAWDVVALAGWPLVWYLRPDWSHVLLPFIIVALYLAVFGSIQPSRCHRHRRDVLQPLSFPLSDHLGGLPRLKAPAYRRQLLGLLSVASDSGTTLCPVILWRLLPAGGTPLHG
jgi:peptidoglycan/LPS O-acetylase OafA/YrhL